MIDLLLVILGRNIKNKIVMDNLLLSFPRSGNTWVRYFLEFLSKRPTSIGLVENCQKGVSKKDAIAIDPAVDFLEKCVVIKRHRADHDWDNWSSNNCNLLFLLRNPKECIIRHSRDGNDLESCIEGFVHCLKFYHNFQGKKKLISYEQLLQDPKKNILEILKFLDISFDHVDDFFRNFEEHRRKSVRNYGAAFTQGDKNQLYKHSRMQPKKANYIINQLKNQNPELFDIYLQKYD
ncbi:MAG TPA: hypothetical protein VK982_11385 [Bacteroidales bacterium]|nr:hypothetical protein [Bacteroidales bacterium]